MNWKDLVVTCSAVICLSFGIGAHAQTKWNI